MTFRVPFNRIRYEGSTVSADDISSIIAFNGQIGVMWSNEIDNAFYFATHNDGEADDAWEASTALSLDDIAFEDGQGTPFIQSLTNLHVNDATSTKQNLNSKTGLLVEASDDISSHYLTQVAP